MNQNLKVSILQVDGEYLKVLLDGLQVWPGGLHVELGHDDVYVRLRGL